MLWLGLMGGNVSVSIVSGQRCADLNHKLSEILLGLCPDGLLYFLISYHISGAMIA